MLDLWKAISDIREKQAGIPDQPPEWLRKAVEANTESIKDMSTSLQRLEVAIGRLKGK